MGIQCVPWEVLWAVPWDPGGSAMCPMGSPIVSATRSYSKHNAFHRKSHLMGSSIHAVGTPIAGTMQLMERPMGYPMIKDSKGMFGRVRTKLYRGGFLGKYPTGPYRRVRYGLNILPNTPVRFGTTSTPVSETPVIPV